MFESLIMDARYAMRRLSSRRTYAALAVLTTDATARRGNMSLTVVNRLADHHWWAPAATLTIATATHRLPADGASVVLSVNAKKQRSKVRVTLTELAAGRTRMELASTFASLEDMEQILAMGAEEGLTQALGQIDALLADAA